MNREALPVYIQIAEELRQNINQEIYQVISASEIGVLSL